MKQKEIESLIDSIGVDALIQHPKIVKALKPLMVECADIAISKGGEMGVDSKFKELENWITKGELMEHAKISSPTLNRLVADGVIRVNTTEKAAHKRYFLPDVIHYITGGNETR